MDKVQLQEKYKNAIAAWKPPEPGEVVKAAETITQDVKKSKSKIVGMDKQINVLKKAIELNEPVLLEGETGAGKTFLILALAGEMNCKVTRLCLNGEVGVTELLGRPTLEESGGASITAYKYGLLIEAMMMGHWIILDEINMALPEVLTILNSLLDDSREITLAENNGEIVKPHNRFRIFATMNPPDGYIGTKELNPALKSRFTCQLFVGYPAPEVEAEIISRTGLEESSKAIIIDVVNAIRAAKKSGEVSHPVGVRDSINWAKMASKEGFNLSLGESFEYSIVNKAAPQERETLLNIAKGICSDIKVSLSTKAGTIENKLTAKYEGVCAGLDERVKILQNTLAQLQGQIAAAVEVKS